MNKVENIIIHCSDSKFGDVDIIRRWHLDRGWKDIGYSAVICNGFNSSTKEYQRSLDGLIQVGRGLDLSQYIEPNEIGSHTLGYNSNSIGLCLIGIDKFTTSQFRSLYNLCNVFMNVNQDIKILGHYETEQSNGKTCPNIDMNRLRRYLLGFETTYSRIADILNGYLKKKEDEL